MKIVTVYRAGGEYRPHHVQILQAQCSRYAPGIPFICMENSKWPGWWAKMEIFKIKGPVLYMDLSNIINKPLKSLLDAAKDHEFIVNRDPNQHQRNVQSCVMAWNGDMSYLHDEFAGNPEEHMAHYQTPRWWGDQGFIERHANGCKYWQDLLPGAVASFKKEFVTGKVKNPVIINFHGKPKPWEVAQC